MEINHAHQSIAKLWQSVGLRKTKIIHREINARQNNGNRLLTRLIIPIAQRRIDERIGNALEANLAIVEHRHPIHTHAHVGFVIGIRELTPTRNKGLLRQIVYFGLIKSV